MDEDNAWSTAPSSEWATAPILTEDMDTREALDTTTTQQHSNINNTQHVGMSKSERRGKRGSRSSIQKVLILSLLQSYWMGCLCAPQLHAIYNAGHHCSLTTGSPVACRNVRSPN